MKIKVHKSIAAKIVLTCSLIVIISLILSDVASYNYVYNICRNQLIDNQKAKISTTVSELGYIADDTKKIATMQAVDSEIQAYLKKPIPESSYEKYSSIQNIKNKLNSISVQREYLNNISLIRNDNSILNDDIIMSNVMTDYGADPDSYLKELKETWYTQMPKGSRDYFSDKYDLSLNHSTAVMLPYILKISNTYSPDQMLGKIIINVDYDYIKNVVVKYSNPDNSNYWFSVSGQVLYKNVSESDTLKEDDIKKYVDRTEEGKSYIYSNSVGYVFVDRTLKNGWVIASVLPYGNISGNLRSIVYFYLLITVIIMVLLLGIFIPTALGLVRPITDLSHSMKRVSAGHMDEKITVKSDDEVGYLAQCYNRMLGDIKMYMKKIKEDEKTKKDFQLNLLLAQINPHFIYNTLQTIVYMAKKEKADDIERMTRSFIGVLQEIVRIGDGGLTTTLDQELEVVRQYFTIQEFRYKGHFEVNWNIDEKYLDRVVPRSILQPIVENSLYHGILTTSKKGIINITVAGTDKTIDIEILDNGIGMDSQTIDKLLNFNDKTAHKGEMRSIGINNVNERIKYICGPEYGLTIESVKDEYTKVCVKLPNNPPENRLIC